MYEKFFNFREKPFKLVPNPAYLFLSKSHEETLAHLNYALAEGVGFVEITGEVGTGKTTLCRAFLNNLKSDTIAAYIFNPRLSPRQLIRAINDELGIKYDADDTKDLVDKLNAFLIRTKAQHKKVILLIDEAQNLSSNVLEQLRLLSNLETNQEKMLQIILVGQPELSEILNTHELRQLSQRITLRYQLSPLNYREMIEYIQYRISIAAKDAGVKFNRSAFRQIYKYSRGIPRVINIVCDRSLLTAFGLNRQIITGSIAKASINELKGAGRTAKFDVADWSRAFIIYAVLALILTAAIYHKPLMRGITGFFKHQQSQEIEGTETVDSASKDTDIFNHKRDPVRYTDNSLVPNLNPSASSTVAGLKASITDIPKYPALTLPSGPQGLLVNELTSEQIETSSLADYLKSMDLQTSRYSALKNAMALWQAPIELKPYLNGLDDDHTFFRLAAKPSGILIHRVETNLDFLRRLDLPVILEFYPTAGAEPGYLTLSQINGDKISFDVPRENKVIETNEREINSYWSGVSYLPWKNFLSISGALPTRTNHDSIITLKVLLHELGYSKIELNSDYDIQTRNAIEEIQTKYGIVADGSVGPLTKIILYKSKGTFEMPRLSKES